MELRRAMWVRGVPRRAARRRRTLGIPTGVWVVAILIGFWPLNFAFLATVLLSGPVLGWAIDVWVDARPTSIGVSVAVLLVAGVIAVAPRRESPRA